MKTIIAGILAANIHDAGIKVSCIKMCKTVKELCQCVIDLRVPKSTMY
jgi:dethiobiotin synthetase